MGPGRPGLVRQLLDRHQALGQQQAQHFLEDRQQFDAGLGRVGRAEFLLQEPLELGIGRIKVFDGIGGRRSMYAFDAAHEVAADIWHGYLPGWIVLPSVSHSAACMATDRSYMTRETPAPADSGMTLRRFHASRKLAWQLLPSAGPGG